MDHVVNKQEEGPGGSHRSGTSVPGVEPLKHVDGLKSNDPRLFSEVFTLELEEIAWRRALINSAADLSASDAPEKGADDTAPGSEKVDEKGSGEEGRMDDIGDAGYGDIGGDGGTDGGGTSAAGGNGGGVGIDGAGATPPPDRIDLPDPPQRDTLVGIALSGGGIRSATFNLGVLQGLNDTGLLQAFDYLSTVSGGGFVGGWWSGWLSRRGINSQRKDMLAAKEEDEIAGRRLRRSYFTEEDLRNPMQLVHALAVPVDDAVRSVVALMRPRARKRIEGWHARSVRGESGIASRNMVKRLLDDLNHLVRRDRALLDDAALDRIGLMTELDRLRRMRAGVSDYAKLNRLILENLFPFEINRGLFPDCEEIEPSRAEDYLFRSAAHRDARDAADGSRRRRRSMLVEGAMNAGRDPIHHLRLFSNYLTPHKGLLSADTWRAVAVVTRNLALTWCILVPILVAIMLLAQFYFLAHPSSSGEFPHPRFRAVQLAFPADQAPRILPPAVVPIRELLRDDSMRGAPGLLRPAPQEASLVPTGVLATVEAGQNMARTGVLSAAAYPAALSAGLSVIGNGYLCLFADQHFVSTGDSLGRRVEAIIWLIAPFVGWVVVMTAAWLFSGNLVTGRLRDRMKMMLWPVAIVALLVLAVFSTMGAGGGTPGRITESTAWWWDLSGRGPYGLVIWVLVAAGLVFKGFWTGIRDVSDNESDMATRAQWRKEVRRNRFTRYHASLLSMVVILTIVLVIAGFGHEIVDYLLVDPNAEWGLLAYVSRAGGWGAVLIAFGGSIFTAFKNLPTGGGDNKQRQQPSAVTRIAIVIVPPLLVLVLALSSGWIAHQGLTLLLGHDTAVAEHATNRGSGAMLINFGTRIATTFGAVMGSAELRLPPFFLLHILLLTGVVICFTFVLQEKEFRPRWIGGVLNLVVLVLYVWNGFRFVTGATPLPFPHAPGWLVVSAALTAGLLLALVLSAGRTAEAYRDSMSGVGTHTFGPPVRRKMWEAILDGLKQAFVWGHRTRSEILIAAVVLAAALCAGVVGVAWALGKTVWLGRGLWEPSAPAAVGYAFYGFICAMLWGIAKTFRGYDHGVRSLNLVFAECVLLIGYMGTMLVYDATIGSTAAAMAHIAVCMIGTVLAWSVALGWITDPNPLSMHEFYKARLTRAYLGASNPRRRLEEKEITEAVQGDDILISDLANCRRGAPYHLINTTLNLAGGRDLTVSQRFAANFVLSKLYCGSTRTGYRRSDRYMNGRMTLGTAVAISGAAASPNMGSKTPSAALAMLMTFFNVRLGYWAPTPNKDDWRDRHARMWPFYVLREFLSQTNDLANYCYLTDGGHFENTGLYSLVERGCRYIVVTDCGADPGRTFADLGDAVRRCRIDFGTEFDLDIAPLRTVEDGGKDKPPPSNYIVGTVRYSKEHVRRLGWRQHLRSKEDRTGIIILIKPTLNGAESVDVRQYGYSHGVFPQQSTGDQWFDEAQFESYRRLGMCTIEQLADGLYKRAQHADQLDLNQMMVLDRARFGRPITLQDVPTFFQAALKHRPKA